jgi:hypothetical protein
VNRDPFIKIAVVMEVWWLKVQVLFRRSEGIVATTISAEPRGGRRRIQTKATDQRRQANKLTA